MLFSFNDLRDFAIEASDGRKGHVIDLYFDDESWQIRYAVAESGFLFTKQESLLNSSVLEEPSMDKRTISVSLTKEQLEEAESPDAHPPVSEQRQRETRLSQMEFWPPIMVVAPGAVYTPTVAESQLRTGGLVSEPQPEADRRQIGDPHLRSLDELSGYAIEAKDGDMGSIADVLLDPDGWKIRYIVVDTGNWLPGRQVAIRPDWVSQISWDGQSVVVNVSKEQISEAPELSEIDQLERSDTYMALAPYGAYAGFRP